MHKVLEFVSTVHDLCAVLGIDFFTTVTEVHPSLNDSTGVQSKSISNDTLARLAKTVLTLKEDKKQRLHKVMHLEHFFLIFIYAITVNGISSQMLGILICRGFCLANHVYVLKKSPSILTLAPQSDITYKMFLHSFLLDF